MDQVIPRSRKRWRDRLKHAVVLLYLTSSFELCCAAAPEPALEYQVKAAFLLNFTKFVEWPQSAFADANSPLALCILGKDPFGRSLDDTVNGEVVNGHRLVVRRMSQVERQACQLVFIPSGTRDVPQALDSLRGGVLTVGDGGSFLREGGMVAFVIVNRRVRFDIDLAAAEKAGLKLSSKLLTVARSVENKDRGVR